MVDTNRAAMVKHVYDAWANRGTPDPLTRYSFGTDELYTATVSTQQYILEESMRKPVFIIFLSLVIMVLACGAACAQEVRLGSYSLQKAEDETTSMKYFIQDVSRLTEESQLIVREACSWDLNGTKLLVAMDFWEHDIQLWLFDINEGFQYGYQLDTSTSGCDRMDAWLSPDGTFLLYLGEETVLGFPPVVETVDDIQEYQVPESIRNFHYEEIVSSQYRVAKAADGVCIVQSPDGELITVYDHTTQYIEYLQLVQKKTLQFAALYFPLFTFLAFMLAKVIKNIQDDRQTTDTHLSKEMPYNAQKPNKPRGCMSAPLFHTFIDNPASRLI